MQVSFTKKVFHAGCWFQDRTQGETHVVKLTLEVPSTAPKANMWLYFHYTVPHSAHFTFCSEMSHCGLAVYHL